MVSKLDLVATKEYIDNKFEEVITRRQLSDELQTLKTELREQINQDIMQQINQDIMQLRSEAFDIDSAVQECKCNCELLSERVEARR